MKKEIKTSLKYIRDKVYGKATERFDDKLLLFTTLSVTAILVVSSVFNVAVKLKPAIIISSVAGSLIFFTLYLVGRFVGQGFIYRLSLGVISLIYIDIIWFLNYGSNGPIMPLFVVLYAFFILVFDKKYFIAISITLFVNLLILFLVEMQFVEEIGSYSDVQTRLMDNYIGMVFSFFIIYSFMSVIKRNYIREYERAKMSDLLKSAFVANMSHEIRTPLNAIIGFSSLMSDSEISDEDKKVFEEQVLSNSDYLLNLIEDIIDVSKIESNQLVMNIREVDVVPVIRQIVQSFQLSIRADKNVKVEASEKMTQLILKVDKVRFEQILRNLLSNAVKFTQEGIIEVGYEKGSEVCTFWVKDTGIGIHFEHQAAIFDRFMKIENGRQHLYRGTGIGLFLSKELVELFGGKIWVESEVGKGSVFYFTIPL
jgi:signal transduction histidine kinase